MCTVSWIHRPGGYDVLCNRDERNSRSRALMPRPALLHGVRHVAPVDPDGGGTWIGSNEYGLTVCLLNAWPAPVRQRLVSRGRLVRSLLACRSSLEATSQIRRRDLQRFAPFTVLALDPDTPARVATWDGSYVLVMPEADHLCPLTSSSLNQKTAHHIRRELWTDMVCRYRGISLPMLEAFHRSHQPFLGEWSVCMHREDAQTVSFTHVNVSPKRVQMHYSPDAPCRADLLVTTTLERRFEDVTAYPARPFHVAG